MEKDVSNKLQKQVNKLDMLIDGIEGAQAKIRDKLDRQIPKDVNFAF